MLFKIVDSPSGEEIETVHASSKAEIHEIIKTVIGKLPREQRIEFQLNLKNFKIQKVKGLSLNSFRRVMKGFVDDALV